LVRHHDWPLEEFVSSFPSFIPLDILDHPDSLLQYPPQLLA
jgi:hypothetical protein